MSPECVYCDTSMHYDDDFDEWYCPHCGEVVDGDGMDEEGM